MVWASRLCTFLLVEDAHVRPQRLTLFCGRVRPRGLVDDGVVVVACFHLHRLQQEVALLSTAIALTCLQQGWRLQLLAGTQKAADKGCAAAGAAT